MKTLAESTKGQGKRDPRFWQRTGKGWMLRPVKRWETDVEVELLRAACRDSFWTHFCWGFGAMANPKGQHWIDESIHKPLADWFQFHVKDWMRKRKLGMREQKHLAVLVHREVGKTTMISQAGQSWLHLLDPEISTYTGSEKGELSQKIMGAIQAVMDGSDPYALWTQLFGNWRTDARKWAAKAAVHAARKNTARADPSMGTFAVETSIVGAHPDAIFYDDPISYERLTTDTNWLKTVNSQITSLYPVLQGDGFMCLVGTSYDPLDHFGVAFTEEGVATVSGMETDAIVPDPDNGKWHVYFMAGRNKHGSPSTPKVWTEKRLKDYQRRDPLRYAAQVMNDPSLSESNPITREQIMANCVVKSDQVPWSALRFAVCTDIAFWDGRSIIGKDETCFYVHGYPRNGSGDVYVVEGDGSSTWRGEDFCKRLVTVVQRYRRQGRKVFAVTGETTRGGAKGTVRSLIVNYFNDANEPVNYIEFERGITKKETRLVAAANFWVDGHVKIVEGCPGFKELIDQMTRIGAYMVNPRTTKIDRVDAHSDAFQPELYQPMRRTGEPERGPRNRREELAKAFSDEAWRDENPRPPIP